MASEPALLDSDRARVRVHLAEARAECESLRRALQRAAADRDAAIKHATALGLSRREIAEIVGLSPAGVQRVVGGP